MYSHQPQPCQLSLYIWIELDSMAYVQLSLRWRIQTRLFSNHRQIILFSNRRQSATVVASWNAHLVTQARLVLLSAQGEIPQHHPCAGAKQVLFFNTNCSLIMVKSTGVLVFHVHTKTSKCCSWLLSVMGPNQGFQNDVFLLLGWIQLRFLACGLSANCLNSFGTGVQQVLRPETLLWQDSCFIMSLGLVMWHAVPKTLPGFQLHLEPGKRLQNEFTLGQNASMFHLALWQSMSMAKDGIMLHKNSCGRDKLFITVFRPILPTAQFNGWG